MNDRESKKFLKKRSLERRLRPTEDFFFSLHNYNTILIGNLNPPSAQFLHFPISHLNPPSFHFCCPLSALKYLRDTPLRETSSLSLSPLPLSKSKSKLILTVDGQSAGLGDQILSHGHILTTFLAVSRFLDAAEGTFGCGGITSVL